MAAFLLRRVAQLPVVLFGLSVAVFLVIHLAPGDPAQLMLGSQATPEAVVQLRSELGLDQPLVVQYLSWLGRAVTGDLGRSLWLNRPVLSEVWDKFQVTALLTFSSLAISTSAGVILGILAATHPHGLWDRVGMAVALFGLSMPVFWIGLIFIIVFAQTLRWLPPTGMYSPGGDQTLADLLSHLIMPSVTLALPSMAIVARLTRSGMLEVLNQDFVRTARAKGLPERLVILDHALRNALIPVVTIVGLQVGYLLGGAILVETVFSWPGVGSLLLRAISARDFPLIQGITLLVALSFVLINLGVDVLYGWLDPRIRYA